MTEPAPDLPPPPTTAEQAARMCRALERQYPDLFDPELAARGQQGRERNSRNRNDPPLPVDERVLDVQRAVNTTVLAWHCTALNALGFPTAGPADVRYRQSPRVLEALRFLAQVAPSLERDRPDLLEALADDLGGLLREVRGALGLLVRAVPLGIGCPARVDGRPCAGELVGLPAKGLVVCRACGQRWHHHDWEALGRTARATEQLRAILEELDRPANEAA